MIQLRPSAAGIWANCAAYPYLAERLPPEPPSDPAMEGTCAAWLAEMVLTGQAETCRDMLGQTHPENGWVVDVEMARHIQGYVDTVRSYGGRIDVERKVRLNEMIEGTPDATAIVKDKLLIVDDLKYGFDPVEPLSEQVVIYAGAILRRASRYNITIGEVRLGIYQPRAYHPSGTHRTIALWPEELMRRVKWIEEAGQRAQHPAPMATPGAHCEYCPAAAICSAVAHENYRIYHRMIAQQARHMTPTEAANELAFLDLAEDMLKARKRAVHAECEARLAKGERIPGWMRHSGKGQRRWKAKAATVKMLTGIDPQGGSMITPAEMERRGADPAVVSLLTETPNTKAKLVRVPDGYYEKLFGKEGK